MVYTELPEDTYLCLDCRIDTSLIREYYMVAHNIWQSLGLDTNSGMLCIGCVEKRLDRTLSPEDFLDCRINKQDSWNEKSIRLQNRLGYL